MLENVGRRSGVGPVSVERLSSHAVTANTPAIMIIITRLLRIEVSVLLGLTGGAVSRSHERVEESKPNARTGRQKQRKMLGKYRQVGFRITRPVIR